MQPTVFRDEELFWVAEVSRLTEERRPFNPCNILYVNSLSQFEQLGLRDIGQWYFYILRWRSQEKKKTLKE